MHARVPSQRLKVAAGSGGADGAWQLLAVAPESPRRVVVSADAEVELRLVDLGSAATAWAQWMRPRWLPPDAIEMPQGSRLEARRPGEWKTDANVVVQREEA